MVKALVDTLHLIRFHLRFAKAPADGTHTHTHQCDHSGHHGHKQQDDVKHQELIKRHLLSCGTHVVAPVFHHVIQPKGRGLHGNPVQLPEEPGVFSSSLFVARFTRHGQNGLGQLVSGTGVEVQYLSKPLPPYPLGVVGLVTEQRHGHDGHGVVQSLVLTVLATVADEHLGVGVTQQVVLGQPGGGQDLGRVGRGQVGPEDDFHGQPLEDLEELVADTAGNTENVAAERNDDNALSGVLHERPEVGKQGSGGPGSRTADQFDVGQRRSRVVKDVIRLHQPHLGPAHQHVHWHVGHLGGVHGHNVGRVQRVEHGKGNKIEECFQPLRKGHLVAVRQKEVRRFCR